MALSLLKPFQAEIFYCYPFSGQCNLAFYCHHQRAVIVSTFSLPCYTASDDSVSKIPGAGQTLPRLEVLSARSPQPSMVNSKHSGKPVNNYSAERYKKSTTGKVWLVGAGPGDPDLLTLKALRAIENADIIFFDQLVSTDIRALFPAGTPSLYVGKAKNHHSIAQEDLNQLLVDQAQAGLTVCRIKGGDPFVFGRGGEELLELRKAGIDAEVIPGITSASGCSTYANIPLTHRGLAQGCTFVTAHAEKTLDVNWHALAQLNHTLVFYMGVTRAENIATELQAAGLDSHTPTAIIENGCRKNQRVLISDIRSLPAMVARENVQSPALIIVGQVVSLAEQLNPNYWHSVAAEASNHYLLA
jgi:uroporphyrin-III C-methyltransferase